MTPTLDDPIAVGNLYCEAKMGTWTLVTDIWVDEDGVTKVRIHDRLFPTVGRSLYDAYHTPESKELTVTKSDFIDRLVISDFGLMRKNASDIEVDYDE